VGGVGEVGFGFVLDVADGGLGGGWWWWAAVLEVGAGGVVESSSSEGGGGDGGKAWWRWMGWSVLAVRKAWVEGCSRAK
jgi:hypothetical protein